MSRCARIVFGPLRWAAREMLFRLAMIVTVLVFLARSVHAQVPPPTMSVALPTVPDGVFPRFYAAGLGHAPVTALLERNPDGTVGLVVEVYVFGKQRDSTSPRGLELVVRADRADPVTLPLTARRRVVRQQLADGVAAVTDVFVTPVSRDQLEAWAGAATVKLAVGRMTVKVLDSQATLRGFLTAAAQPDTAPVAAASQAPAQPPLATTWGAADLLAALRGTWATGVTVRPDATLLLRVGPDGAGSVIAAPGLKATGRVVGARGGARDSLFFLGSTPETVRWRAQTKWVANMLHVSWQRACGDGPASGWTPVREVRLGGVDEASFTTRLAAVSADSLVCR